MNNPETTSFCLHAAHLLQSYELFVGSAKHQKHLMVFFLGPSWPYKTYNVQQNPTSSVISMSFPGCFRHFQEMCLLTGFPHPFSIGFPMVFPPFSPPTGFAPPWTRQVQRLADELQKYDTDFETAKIWVGKQVRMAFCGQWMGDTLNLICSLVG